MALRSTIVYPLGTIAVQMGAPENLALLRDNEDSGLVVGLVLVGVPAGVGGDRGVELVAAAEVGGHGDGVAGAAVSAGQGPSA